MIFAVLTFAISLTLMLGLYWVFVVRAEASDKALLTGRLQKLKIKPSMTSIVNAPERLSAIPLLDKLLTRQRRLARPLDQLVTESGLKMTVGALVLMMFLGASVGAVLGWAMSRLSMSVLLGAIGALLPYGFVRYKRSVRLRVFEEQFPEAIELIARALRAGHAFTTGLSMAAEEIEAPVGTEFKRVYDEQNFGMSLQDALKAMAKRVPVLDARFFVTAVLTQRESGGNLSEVLDNLASVMRERFKVKRQIRVISAHGRISAWVLSCLAPALAVALFLLNPQFMSILWEDPLGVQLVIMAVILQTLGTIIIARLVRIEY